jgi:hypothetical protein
VVPRHHHLFHADVCAETPQTFRPSSADKHQFLAELTCSTDSPSSAASKRS